MPTVTAVDRMYLHVCTLRQAGITAYSSQPSKHPFPIDDVLRLVVSDRLRLAGEHLSTGDSLILANHFRSAISRYYYGMYHAARAIVFATEKGDDYERHAELPRHLPQGLTNPQQLEVALTDARLLRNQADYDPYPASNLEWEGDARTLAATAAQFVAECENFALTNGHV